jgi:integral membrane protein
MYLITFAIVTAFIAFLMYSFIYLATPKKKIYDFIIIHGAGLRDGEYVTTLLKQRIDKAIEAYHNSSNPNIKIICSGGQGSDEKVSEAKAMANYIASNTEVTMSRVLLEEKSTTTYENLLFSKEIGEELVDKPKFLFVTNNYHVYRTSAYARKIKMDGDGLGCRTAGYYIPSAFIREFIAACVKIKWAFVVLYAILFIFLFLL